MGVLVVIFPNVKGGRGPPFCKRMGKGKGKGKGNGKGKGKGNSSTSYCSLHGHLFWKLWGRRREGGEEGMRKVIGKDNVSKDDVNF